MTKEQLQERLDYLKAAIDQNIAAHNEMIKERDALANESMARHNKLIGQRDEVQEWLNKFAQDAQ